MGEQIRAGAYGKGVTGGRTVLLQTLRQNELGRRARSTRRPVICAQN